MIRVLLVLAVAAGVAGCAPFVQFPAATGGLLLGGAAFAVQPTPHPEPRTMPDLRVTSARQERHADRRELVVEGTVLNEGVADARDVVVVARVLGPTGRFVGTGHGTIRRVAPAATEPFRIVVTNVPDGSVDIRVGFEEPRFERFP